MLYANINAAILAEESCNFSARITGFIQNTLYLADNWNPCRKKRHFFCEDLCCISVRHLSALPCCRVSLAYCKALPVSGCAASGHGVARG